MGRPKKSLQAYRVQIENWETAIERGGIFLKFDLGRQAIQYRQNLYQARKLYTEQTKDERYFDLNIEMTQGGSRVHSRTIDMDAPAELRIASNSTTNYQPQILDLKGNPIIEPATPDLTPAEDEVDEELLLAALDAKKGLGLR